MRDLVTGARPGVHFGGLSGADVRRRRIEVVHLLDDAAGTVEGGYDWQHGLSLVVGIASVTLSRRIGLTGQRIPLPNAFGAALLVAVGAKPGEGG
jgi:hypothetical protein